MSCPECKKLTSGKCPEHSGTYYWQAALKAVLADRQRLAALVNALRAGGASSPSEEQELRSERDYLRDVVARQANRITELQSSTPSEAGLRAWEPIATAPKDGTWVLLWAPLWRHPSVGCYVPGVTERECFLDGYNNPESGWHTHATHWMSLPTPPREGRQGEK